MAGWHITSGTAFGAIFSSEQVIRMKKKSGLTLATAAMLFLPLPAPAGSAGAEATSLLATIKAVGREGAGNVEAARAWQELVRLGSAALPAAPAAFDDAAATVANLLQPAGDTIAGRSLAAQHA